MKTDLPRWDMSVVYSGLDSPEFERDLRSFVRALDELEGLFDEAQIDRTQSPLNPDLAAGILERILPPYNALNDQAWTLGAYVYAFVSVDSRDEYAQARLSELERHTVRLSKLHTRLTAWAGSQEVDALLERSEQARQHAYWLQRARVIAEHMMSPAEEALTAEMRLTGSNAWTRLYGNLTSQIQATVEIRGERQTLTMSMLRNLATDADREVRDRKSTRLNSSHLA